MTVSGLREVEGLTTRRKCNDDAFRRNGYEACAQGGEITVARTISAVSNRFSNASVNSCTGMFVGHLSS
jgi:hypothetical protein